LNLIIGSVKLEGSASEKCGNCLMMSLFTIPLIDRYIIKQLIQPWIISLCLCSILGEVIGISFEQIQFITERNFSTQAAFQVHLLKFPAFISLGLPFSLLMATMITYGKLSQNNEIIALKCSGVRLIRLVVPALIFSLIITILMFFLNALIVPYTNYQAAMIIENEFQIERNNLPKYHQKNIIYQNFSWTNQSQLLTYLIIADRFDGQKLYGITALKYQKQHLHKIIMASSAVWDRQLKLWIFVDGKQQIIAPHDSHSQLSYFRQLALPIDQNLLYYVQNYRDNREMSLPELYRWLNVLRGSNDLQKIRQLQINIQERYTLPFSCIVFTLLGGILGCNHSNKINKISLVIVIIISYQAIQFIATSLCITGLIAIKLGIWFPNMIGLSLSGIFLNK
jgi:lipopolysaccharide export system permease protein